VLIRTRHGKFDEVVRIVKQIKGVKTVFPVLGRYDVVAEVEAPDHTELGRIILKMGRLAGVVFTETLVELQH